MAFEPELIAVHTAAHGRYDKDYDTTVQDLYQWHVKENGWSDVGYHFLVRKGGDVHPCRPLERVGAHVRGWNSRALGVCFSGHGDIKPWTPEQWEGGLELLRELMFKFEIPDVEHVKGHREFPRVAKSCPGKLVDMEEVRARLHKLLIKTVALPEDNFSQNKESIHGSLRINSLDVRACGRVERTTQSSGSVRAKDRNDE